MRFNFRTIACSYAQDNFLQNCIATHLTCRITFHITACYDTNILSILLSSLFTFCPSKYITAKKFMKISSKMLKMFKHGHDVNQDICFLCSKVLSYVLLVMCRGELSAVIVRLMSKRP